MKVNFSRLKVAWNSLCQQANITVVSVVVVQWLLLTTFKHFIWSYFILTATEEHENKVPQNEGGTECSLPGVNNKKSDSGT